MFDICSSGRNVKILSSRSTSASLVRRKNWYSSKGDVLFAEIHTALPADLPSLSPVSLVTSGIVKPFVKEKN